MTKEGDVRHSPVSQLAVLELAYNSCDFNRENLDKVFAELANANNKLAHNFIMRTSWKSFPRLHQIIHREKDARPTRTKTEVVAIIGSYLWRVKYTAKNIVEFAYGKSGSDRAVLTKERTGMGSG